jgi:hypothetical protein
MKLRGKLVMLQLLREEEDKEASGLLTVARSCFSKKGILYVKKDLNFDFEKYFEFEFRVFRREEAPL